MGKAQQEQDLWKALLRDATKTKEYVEVLYEKIKDNKEPAEDPTPPRRNSAPTL